MDRTEKDIQDDIGSLALLLYSLFYDRNKHIDEFTKELKECFLDAYTTEELLMHGKSIQNYFKYKDINLLLIHPGMNATVDEMETYLQFLLDGFIQNGFIEKNQ